MTGCYRNHPNPIGTFLRFLQGFLLRFLRLIASEVLQNMCALAERVFLAQKNNEKVLTCFIEDGVSATQRIASAKITEKASIQTTTRWPVIGSCDMQHD